jgi:tetratricopeptide (TPR) repeat protein
MTLLLTLTACGSMPTKEKSSKQVQSILAPSSVSDPLNVRAEADYHFIQGDVLSREGKSMKAIEHFEKVVKLDPTSAALYLRLSTEYQKVNKNKEAILNAEKAIEKDAKNVAAHFALGGLLSAEKSYDKAIEQYNIVLRVQPKNSDAALNVGSLYAIQKDYKKAELYFNSLLKDPNFELPHLVHYYIGLMKLDQKAPQYEMAAETAFKKSLKVKPDHEDALLSLANLYLYQKNPGKAVALCQEYQKKEQFSAKVADLIAQTYIDNGEFDKAYEQLDYTAAHSENTLDAEMKMALILIKSKRYSQATEKLGEILTKNPQADQARYYLAAVHEESGDKKNAIREYMLIPQSSEHYPEAMAHAAFLLKGLGKINQALNLTTQGLKTKADPQLYIMHASLLEAKADYTAATRILEEGLSKYSKNTELRFQHAIMLDRLGKKDAMMAQMKKVLEIAPDHVQSLSYLAFSLAERNQNLSDAEKMARQASELAPQDGYVLDTLGWVLYKQKNYSESVKVLEKAHEYQPLASIIAEHLADAYLMHSQTDKAKAMYNKAAGLTTDMTRANKIRSKL